MLMLTVRRAAGVVAALAVAVGAGWSEADALTKIGPGRLTCRGQAFAMEELAQTLVGSSGNDWFFAESVLGGQTEIECSDGSKLTLDVWEHAYLKLRSKGSTPVVGNIVVRTGDGSDQVTFEGKLRGSGACDSDVCELGLEVRGRSDSGGEIDMHQVGTLDLRGEEWRDFGVDFIFLDSHRTTE